MNFYSEEVINYMNKHDISRQMFACICRISISSIYYIMLGRIPGPLLSKKIFIGTKGEVNFNIPYLRDGLKINGSKKIHSKSSVVCD